ncbi:MAG: bifunctional adenosylcobinamide kinase/adenosylcobinamide-phosphate guanylyltransferase [Firmicutes bacterium]|nr:bifunctional adenosylcobinamide kinase/adenosylcobinamide-phosphate guanylyltransferase [Bacillota bacterium]
MIFIFGGAYQGKLEYAMKNYSITEVCDCGDGREPDLSADAICGIAGYVMECVKNGRDAALFFEGNSEALRDKILINTDVSSGVVPVDRQEREFREMNGRVNILLAEMADKVIHVFCGIGKTMK